MLIDKRLIKVAKKLINKKVFVPKFKSLRYVAELKEWVATDSLNLMRHKQNEPWCDFDFSIDCNILDTIKVKDKDDLVFEVLLNTLKVFINWELVQEIPIKKDPFWIDITVKNIDGRQQELWHLDCLTTNLKKFIELCEIIDWYCVPTVKEKVIDIDANWFYLCIKKPTQHS